MFHIIPPKHPPRFTFATLGTLATLGVSLLASCERLELPPLAEELPVDDSGYSGEVYAKKFTFTVKGDFLNPDFIEGTRSNAYMTADGTEMTDLWVIDYKDATIKQQLHQKQTDADFGTPTMPLSLGTHHVLFLASRGSEPSYANGIVTWTRPLVTFYLDYEVTVVKTSNGNRAVTLQRVSTKMLLNIDDAIPSGTTTITLTPSTWFTGWNMLTGEPVKHDFTRTFDIPSSWIGKSGASLTLWSLSSPDEWQTSITVTSHAGSLENSTATIPDAPFKANRATVYHGNLYTAAPSTSSVKLTTEWLNDYEGVY